MKAAVVEEWGSTPVYRTTPNLKPATALWWPPSRHLR